MKDLTVKLGDTVKKGQVLFTLDEPTARRGRRSTLRTPMTRPSSRVDQANPTCVSAKTSLASTYASTHTALAAKQAVAAVTSANLAVQAAENAVTSAQIALQDAKDNAAARTVTAPMAGVDHDALRGERRRAPGVQRRRGLLRSLVITDPSAYQADLTLAESDISTVEAGSEGRPHL